MRERGRREKGSLWTWKPRSRRGTAPSRIPAARSRRKPSERSRLEPPDAPGSRSGRTGASIERRTGGYGNSVREERACQENPTGTHARRLPIPRWRARIQGRGWRSRVGCWATSLRGQHPCLTRRWDIGARIEVLYPPPNPEFPSDLARATCRWNGPTHAARADRKSAPPEGCSCGPAQRRAPCGEDFGRESRQRRGPVKPRFARVQLARAPPPESSAGRASGLRGDGAPDGAGHVPPPGPPLRRATRCAGNLLRGATRVAVQPAWQCNPHTAEAQPGGRSERGGGPALASASRCRERRLSETRAVGAQTCIGRGPQ